MTSSKDLNYFVAMLLLLFFLSRTITFIWRINHNWFGFQGCYVQCLISEAVHQASVSYSSNNFKCTSMISNSSWKPSMVSIVSGCIYKYMCRRTTAMLLISFHLCHSSTTAAIGFTISCIYNCIETPDTSSICSSHTQLVYHLFQIGSTNFSPRESNVWFKL